MADVLVVEVRLWGEQVGAVAPLPGRPGYYEFEYAPAFIRSGVSPAPIKMPPPQARTGMTTSGQPDGGQA